MSEPTYEVGYGKPPLHSRFKPGQSGYTGGRKQAKPSPSELLDRILEEKLTVSEGGKSKRMPKLEVFLRQLVAHAIANDRQSVKLVLDYLNKRQEQPDAKTNSSTDTFLLAELTRMIGDQDESEEGDRAGEGDMNGEGGNNDASN